MSNDWFNLRIFAWHLQLSPDNPFFFNISKNMYHVHNNYACGKFELYYIHPALIMLVLFIIIIGGGISYGYLS